MITRRNILALTGMGLVAGGSVFNLLRGGQIGLSGLAGIGAANAQGTAVQIEDITLGDEKAPVKVIEYASFTCPHCANFHNDTYKDFKRDYIDTGKVHFTYREVFFDRYGLWAAMVARCAGPDRYMSVADILYRTQREWARQGDAAAVADSLKRIGVQAGLSQEEVDACLNNADLAQSLVSWYEANADADNIRSTPSFLINGELSAGNMGLAQIGTLIDAAAN